MASMTRDAYVPSGVIPACLMPFRSDLEIDEPAYRKHLRDLASVSGITAITVNGHAAEVHALDFDEQQRAVAIARDEIGDTLPLIVGVHTSNPRQGERIARMAEHLHADALLIFPSNVLSLGGQQKPEAAQAHIGAVAEATDLPLVLFQYPLSSGLGYPLDTLLQLCHKFPTIRAIKDWCNDPALHERHIRELHALDHPVKVLTTHSAWLLASLVLGCDGLLSGAGSVIADLHVALWQAVQRNDLKRARELNDRIYPTVRAFYSAPLLDMHNRMKESLVLLGRLDAAHVRPPLTKLDASEIAQISVLLRQAGLSVTPAVERAR
jgi:4-hydroxy-tetrahydrodipicolinate synthase